MRHLWQLLIILIVLDYSHGASERYRLENEILINHGEEHMSEKWYPYKGLYELTQSNPNDSFCPERKPAIKNFPTGWWSREERLRGRFLVHIFTSIYLFIFLAFICDRYFLPTVERICEVLDISPDVAATTFMATATTIPEFFSNTISTFIAESDMGLSAIVGSMLFNTLGVAACASLFTKRPIQIDWWPISRDTFLFISFLVTLVVIAWDGMIYWWETYILISLYIFYWILMFQNPRIMKFFKGVVEDRFLWCQRIKNYDIVNQIPKDQNEPSPVVDEEIKNGLDNPNLEGSSSSIYAITTTENYRKRSDSVDFTEQRGRRQSTDFTEIYAVMDENEFKIWEIPHGVSTFQVVWFFFTWPIRFTLHYTIPHPIKHKYLFPLSFLMCIVWIGLSSYMVFWMVVIIGDTFGIPDPIMGLTFLAFGGCMPEAISAVIVARKGSGQMGVSNALGANCLAILFSLGLPWFINTMIDGAGQTKAYIRIYSHAMEFTISAIILAALTLYIVVAAAGYKLRKTVGAILGFCYMIFATYAILVELGFFFESSCK